MLHGNQIELVGVNQIGMGVADTDEVGPEKPGRLLYDTCIFFGRVLDATSFFDEFPDLIGDVSPRIESGVAPHDAESITVLHVPGSVAQSIVELAISVLLLIVDLSV
jgi:hypothetical protein